MSIRGDGGEGSDPLAALLRWEASGATWVVTSVDGPTVSVDLVSCDGGEVMGHLASAEPGFVAHVLAADHD
jgi:hypothetical protein